MQPTTTHRLGAALVGLSLFATGVPRDLFAGQPVPESSNKSSTAPSERTVTLSRESIWNLLTAAHVGLTVVGESTPSFASGVLVQASKGMYTFLHADEILVLSASHNFADWNKQTRVHGTLFTPSARNQQGANFQRVTHDVRLIGRFVDASKERSMTTGKRPSVDIAFLAMTVPHDQVDAVRSRALPVAAAADALPRAGTTVYAAGSPGFESLPSGEGFVVSKPIIGQGVVTNPNSQTRTPLLRTQYGDIRYHQLKTTERCEPGESGGALVRINDNTGVLEVVGVASTGGETPGGATGWIDFPPELVGVNGGDYASLDDLAKAVFKKIPEAKSKYRGHFSGVLNAHELERVLLIRYEEYLNELEQIDTIYEKLRRDLLSNPQSTIDIAQLDELHQKARSPILSELHDFKPPRD